MGAPFHKQPVSKVGEWERSSMQGRSKQAEQISSVPEGRRRSGETCIDSCFGEDDCAAAYCTVRYSTELSCIRKLEIPRETSKPCQGRGHLRALCSRHESAAPEVYLTRTSRVRFVCCSFFVVAVCMPFDVSGFGSRTDPESAAIDVVLLLLTNERAGRARLSVP